MRAATIIIGILDAVVAIAVTAVIVKYSDPAFFGLDTFLIWAVPILALVTAVPAIMFAAKSKGRNQRWRWLCCFRRDSARCWPASLSISRIFCNAKRFHSEVLLVPCVDPGVLPACACFSTNRTDQIAPSYSSSSGSASDICERTSGGVSTAAMMKASTMK